jgi:hypothetical protein
MSKGFWIVYPKDGRLITRNTWEKDSRKWPKGAKAILPPGCAQR